MKKMARSRFCTHVKCRKQRRLVFRLPPAPANEMHVSSSYGRYIIPQGEDKQSISKRAMQLGHSYVNTFLFHTIIIFVATAAATNDVVVVVVRFGTGISILVDIRHCICVCGLRLLPLLLMMILLMPIRRDIAGRRGNAHVKVCRCVVCRLMILLQYSINGLHPCGQGWLHRPRPKAARLVVIDQELGQQSCPHQNGASRLRCQTGLQLLDKRIQRALL